MVNYNYIAEIAVNPPPTHPPTHPPPLPYIVQSQFKTSNHARNSFQIFLMKNYIKYIIYNVLTDYVEDIYQTMIEAIRSKQLGDAIDELKEQTPSPMNTMLNKQSKEAIQKRNMRNRMQLVDVPPTNPGIVKFSSQTDTVTVLLKSVNNAMMVDNSKFVTFFLFQFILLLMTGRAIHLNQEVHQNAGYASSQ